MATENQYLAHLAGDGSRPIRAIFTTLTMLAGAEADGSVTIPQGSYFRGIKVENSTAFTGAPTNINFRAGVAADYTGQTIVADADYKAAGHFAPTIVAAYDVQGAASAAALTIYFRIAATGGTNPAGAVVVIVEYAPPVV